MRWKTTANGKTLLDRPATDLVLGTEALTVDNASEAIDNGALESAPAEAG